jgi:hypothetical protein
MGQGKGVGKRKSFEERNSVAEMHFAGIRLEMRKEDFDSNFVVERVNFVLGSGLQLGLDLSVNFVDFVMPSGNCNMIVLVRIRKR